LSSVPQAASFASEEVSAPILSRSKAARNGKRGPCVAETFPVHVEDSYVIIET